jgi:hypothetical protein
MDYRSVRVSLCQARVPEALALAPASVAVGAPWGRSLRLKSRPALAGRREAAPRQAVPAVHVAVQRVRCPARAPPPLALVAAVQCLRAVPHGLPTVPTPPAPPPRPEPRRTVPHRGQPPWAPVAGRSPALPTPSSASNRRLVTSSTSSTHSLAKGATRVAQFRRAAPAAPPRDHIAKLKFFSRASLQLVTQIVKVP